MITHSHGSILGDVPASWAAVPLRQCLRNRNRVTGATSTVKLCCECSALRTSRTLGRLISQTLRCEVSPRKTLRDSRFVKGTFFFERSGGGPGQPVGRVVSLDHDLPGYAFSNFVQLLRVDSSVMNPDFVAWCLFQLNSSE